MLSRISAVLFVLTIPIALFAQETRATIVGRVTDASGGVVPGASVVVVNKAMGTRTALTTNEQGLFEAPLLIPGEYQVVAERSGFKRFIQDKIELRINDKIEVNAALEVGSPDQSITVEGTAEQLTTESGSLGTVIDARRVADLPLSYGNPFSLIGLAGGVAFGGDPRLDRPFEPTHIVGYAMDGTRSNRSDVTIDGAPATATANGGQVIASYVPPTDIVQEFKVQTAPFDAATGQTEGGVTNISIKAGTNTFHGTAYYSITRPSLWANDFFNNSLGKQRPDFSFNRWGGSVGGPVILPKLYNGKNKTFFMFGEEGIHDSRPRYDSGTPTVPTAAMKMGDFSSLLAVGSQYQIYNPYTRRLVGGVYQEDPFPGNIIPSNLFSPIGSKILNTYFPAATSPAKADGTQNLLRPELAEKAKYYNWSARFDQNIGDKQRLFFRISDYRRDSLYNNYFDNVATGVFFQFLAQAGVVDHVYVLSPTSLINVRYGYNRFIRAQDGNPEGTGFDLTKLGFAAGYNNQIPADIRRFPRIDVSGYIGTAFTGEYRPVDTHSVSAVYQKTLSSHSLRAGVDFRSYRETDGFFSNNQTGQFTFDSGFTKGPLSTSSAAPSSLGQSVAALLLGIPTSVTATVAANYAEQSTAWGIYLQDDWKLSPKLTLNIGLREEFETPLTERFNRSLRGLDASYVQPLSAAAQANYAKNPTPEVAATQFISRGGVTFAGVNGQPRGLYETPKLNLMPRFGVAYHVFPNTVLRGGFGMFYGFLGERRGDVVQSGFSQTTTYSPFAPDGVTLTGSIANPFPNGIIQPVGAAAGLQTNLGQSITIFNEHPLIPRMMRWQLSAQHQFKGGFVFEAAYVGNKGTRIEIGRNLNTLPAQYLSTLPTRDDTRNTYLSTNLPNPFAGLMPVTAGTTFTNTSIARSRLLAPFPEFDAVNSTTNDGYSWYHALQVRFEKRFSKGFTILSNYTYSKFMQATELLNASDAKPVRVISDQDIPHRISLSSIVELPFGRGHRMLGNANGVLDRVVNGWEVTGYWNFQSGFPLSFGNIFFNGDVNNIALSPDERSVARFINTDAGFVKTSSLQPVANLRTFPLRFSFIRAQAQTEVNLAVIKRIRIIEKQDFELRVEALNAFNHPLLPTPNLTPTAAAFGTVSGSTQSNYPRRLQFTFKYRF